MIRRLDEYPDVEVFVKYATEHRCGVCIRGPNLSDCITGTDPLKDGLPLMECKPTNDSFEAKRTAEIVNRLSRKLNLILAGHQVNIERKGEGKNVANIILFRGGGTRLDLQPFQQKWPGLFESGNDTSSSFAIAPTCMISGWMQTIGVEMISEGMEKATGDYRTDVNLKGERAVALLTRQFREPSSERLYSFGFLHVKAVDDAGHDGLLDVKVEFIEKIDKMLGAVHRELETSSQKTGCEYLIAVTADHSTPLWRKDHSCEPVPFMISRVRSASPKSEIKFSETSVASGKLGRFRGDQVFPIIQRILSGDEEK